MRLAERKCHSKDNPCYGKLCMHNNDLKINKFVLKEQIQIYLDNGWIMGKIKK